jgi:hypothetical protein
MMICRMAIPNDLAGVLCSGRLRRRTLLGNMPGDCWPFGSNSCVPIFFSDRLVSDGARLSFVICCHHGTHLTIHGEVRSNGGSSLYDDEELPW